MTGENCIRNKTLRACRASEGNKTAEIVTFEFETPDSRANSTDAK